MPNYLGQNPLGYEGVRPTTPAQMIVMRRAPTAQDVQGYALGTQWVHRVSDDPSTSRQYVLASLYDVDGSGNITQNSAVWVPLDSNATPITLPVHSVALGTGVPGLSSVGPEATLGLPLLSQGTGADPIFDVLSPSGGGTGLATYIPYSVVCGGTTPTDAFQQVVDVGTAGQVLTSNGASALPTWEDPDIPPTLTLPAHSVALGTGAPGLSSVGPEATLGLPLLSQGTGTDPLFQVLDVDGGGTGLVSMTPYSVLCGGTSSTADVQQVSGTGSSGQVLTSNGPLMLPTWQDSGGGGSGGSGAAKVTLLTVGSGTFVLDTGTTLVSLYMWGAGAGGGSGARTATSGVAANGSGGGGSAGGLGVFTDIPVSFFGGAGASVSYSVSAGGAGGAAVLVDDTTGNAGGIGFGSVFGNYRTLGGSPGGWGGNSNTLQGQFTYINNNFGEDIPSFPVGGGGFAPDRAYSGGRLAGNITTNGVDAANTPQRAIVATCGGGGRTRAGSGGRGGNGGTSNSSVPGGAGGVFSGASDGGDGTDGFPAYFCGGSGGGGGAPFGTSGTGKGGNGGYPGGGGGGGSSSINGSVLGAGGNGGDGAIFVIEYLAANSDPTYSFTEVSNTDSPYTVLATDEVIACNSTAGTITILLPDITTTGRPISVKDSYGTAQTNNITITTPSGTVLIDQGTSIVLNTNYASFSFVFDGTDYLIL